MNSDIDIIIAKINPKQFICPLCGSIKDIPDKPYPIILHNDKDDGEEICDLCIFRLIACCNEEKNDSGRCKVNYNSCKECIEEYEKRNKEKKRSNS